MKDWIAANLFLLGMPTFAAAILFAGVSTLRTFALDELTERRIAGLITVFAIFATGITFRWLLKRIQRRR